MFDTHEDILEFYDRIEEKNGDELTGEIVHRSSNPVTGKIDYVIKITMKGMKDFFIFIE